MWWALDFGVRRTSTALATKQKKAAPGSRFPYAVLENLRHFPAATTCDAEETHAA